MTKPRRYNYRRNLPHIEKDNRAVFITFCTYQDWILPARARDLVLEHCLREDGQRIELHAVVVMPNHVHILFTPLRDTNTELFSFAEIMSGIKGASAHSINKALRRKGHVWQDESFDHVLRCEEAIAQKVDYICNNPVRRGLASSPDKYRWLWREGAVSCTAGGGCATHSTQST